MWRSLQNYLRHAASRSPRGFHPLLAVHYLTYACRFRCPYCCDGHGVRYSDLRSPTLRAAEALELYARIRRRCDFLVITGGEPLDHPEVDEILTALPRLRFDGVVLTTRGEALDGHLDALEAVPSLVVSLDTVDPVKGDAWLGTPGTHARILRNLQLAASRRRRGSIVVSTVATPENLPDVAEVHRFAKELGLRHSVSPQLVGVHPHPALFERAEYRALMDGLVREKRAGGAVEGTVAYLEYLRDLKPFGCRPSTVLAVSPAGDVFYPCLELGNVAGNLLAEPDLDRIRAAGKERFGPEPRCGPRCQSPCALGFALLFARPWIVLDEGWRALLAALRSSRRAERRA
ncbi:MAG TPA: radical SAM protein [Anaeromyxobacter sp.]|nr:radical SAM protein [Anaeromyxobacter sp.]